ncbi:hypothetical protein EKH55_0321 [Sinorhizobium alkalisoli]|nr:hypothetical protein EKH55_0321 [Sinorhizobium alkalisoli]
MLRQTHRPLRNREFGSPSYRTDCSLEQFQKGKNIRTQSTSPFPG